MLRDLKTVTTNLHEISRKMLPVSCLFVLFRGYFLSFMIVPLVLFAASCSVPNLEEPACTEARTEIRQFYSFHFAGDMKPSAENLKLREKYLTPRLFEALSASNETALDYFTATGDYPKAFRTGACRVVSPSETEFEVILFWRDDNRSEQKEVIVRTVRQGDKWLIDKVVSK